MHDGRSCVVRPNKCLLGGGIRNCSSWHSGSFDDASIIIIIIIYIHIHHQHPRFNQHWVSVVVVVICLKMFCDFILSCRLKYHDLHKLWQMLRRLFLFVELGIRRDSLWFHSFIRQRKMDSMRWNIVQSSPRTKSWLGYQAAFPRGGSTFCACVASVAARKAILLGSSSR